MGSKSLQDENSMEEPPPPFQQDLEPLSLAETLQGANVTDDGLVEVNIHPELCRRLTQLLNFKDTSTPIKSPVDSERHISAPNLNIVVQVIGSRGDIQPFVALGNELQRHGHRVRLATHDVFRDFIKSSGLEFYPVGGDPSDLMAYMVKNPGLIPNMKNLRAGDIQSKRKMIAEMLECFWRSCIAPDLDTGDPFVADAIIANPPSFAHVHCAQALGVPLHMMFTMPWTSTRAFPHPLANMRQSKAKTDRAALNYLSYGIVQIVTWQGISDIVNKWRDRTLNLESVPLTEGALLLETLDIPFTYCWSPALVPKPEDWGLNVDICGFLFRDTPKYEPPPELQTFLDGGPKPIYIGFGSIVVDDVDRIAVIVLKAVSMAGVRAIISRGWSKLQGQENPDVFYIDDCPHEWLFQHVAAVVHHGGAGTTACGLKYGRPTVVVPFFGDQPFWGRTIAAAGAGPDPIPYSQLTSRRLAEAISFACLPHVEDAAVRIADRMSTERGTKNAVDFFHESLPQLNTRCELFPKQPAAWKYKGDHRNVLLSKKACCILQKYSKIDLKRLKLHETKPIVVDNRRWDPFTAVSSASISTVARVGHAAANILAARDEASKHLNNSKPRADRIAQTVHSDTAQHIAVDSLNAGNETEETASPPGSSNSQHKQTGFVPMALNTASGAGKLVSGAAKGILVDIPLAATDGLRAVPRLYGEDVTRLEKITDLKSGTTVAGKAFGQGMYEAFTDAVMYTYKGKQEEGPKGVAKGLAKGLSSFITKTGAATLGLFAYPAQGLHRSIHTALRTDTRKAIEQAKTSEGTWLVAKQDGDDEEYASLVADFETLRRSKYVE